jgi:hypothetical protein
MAFGDFIEISGTPIPPNRLQLAFPTPPAIRDGTTLREMAGLVVEASARLGCKSAPSQGRPVALEPPRRLSLKARSSLG